MKACAARAFRTLPQEKQALYYGRYGQWFERRGCYLRALTAYREGSNFDGCLRVVEKDAGIQLATLPAAATLEMCIRDSSQAHSKRCCTVTL